MARWASLIDRRRSENPVLLIDAGNFLPAKEGRFDLDNEDIYTFNAMEMLDYNAVLICENELLYGNEKLLKTAERSGLPLFSTNIFDRESGKPAAARWIVMDVGGKRTLWGRKGSIRIGIFGVVLPSYVHRTSPPMQERYEIISPGIAALEAVSTLREKGCDLIIAVSHQGWKKSLEFAKEIPGVDLVINGHRRHFETYSQRSGDALVVDTGIKRTSFTEITVDFAGGEKSISAADMGKAARSLKGRADLLELEKRYQNEKRKKDIESRKGS